MKNLLLRRWRQTARREDTLWLALAAIGNAQSLREGDHLMNKNACFLHNPESQIQILPPAINRVLADNDKIFVGNLCHP